MTTRSEQLLTPAAIPYAKKLAKRVGSLKLALSAGLVALDGLSSQQREQAIDTANAEIEPQSGKAPKPLRDILRTIGNMVEKEAQGGSKIKILSQEDSAALEQLRELLGPSEALKRRHEKHLEAARIVAAAESQAKETRKARRRRSQSESA